MEELKNRILTDGRALNEDVLLVGSFLNQQVDAGLMARIGAEFARLAEPYKPTRIATIESSGIAPAVMTALAMGLPLVIMKKSASRTLTEGLLTTEVRSFTKNLTYTLVVDGNYLLPGDRVLVIDDFLANGEAALGAKRLIERAGARVAAVGTVIEKSFQPGRGKLEDAGVPVLSLARVKRMAEGEIEFV